MIRLQPGIDFAGANHPGDLGIVARELLDQGARFLAGLAGDVGRQQIKNYVS
ncbi:MAG: hypothetical protein ACPGJE_01110 [Wenzhouxiangellaceae bacterium]